MLVRLMYGANRLPAITLATLTVAAIASGMGSGMVLVHSKSASAHVAKVTPKPSPSRAPVPTPSPTPVATGPAALVAGLLPGSCQVQRPSGTTGPTVFIDAGHGGPDPGTWGVRYDGTFITEKDATLGTAKELAGVLVAAGDVAVMARTTDSGVSPPASGDLVDGAYTPDGIRHDLLARIACANAAKADVLVSIHFNAAANPDVGGLETIYDADRTFVAANLELATDIHQGVLHHVGPGDQGIVKDTDAGTPALSPAGDAYGHLIIIGPPKAGYVDAPSTMPGALVEALYLTNPAEADFAGNDAGQHQIAVGIAEGLAKYFKAHPVSGKPTGR